MKKIIYRTVSHEEYYNKTTPLLVDFDSIYSKEIFSKPQRFPSINSKFWCFYDESFKIYITLMENKPFSAYFWHLQIKGANHQMNWHKIVLYFSYWNTYEKNSI